MQRFFDRKRKPTLIVSEFVAWPVVPITTPFFRANLPLSDICSCCNKPRSDCERLRATNLVQLIVNGEQVCADEVMSVVKSPDILRSLLRHTIELKDYSRRLIKGTALQFALGAEDVRYHDNEECMTELIIRHLKTLPDGNKIIAEQIREHYSENYLSLENTKAEANSTALQNVFKAIAVSRNNDNCIRALRTFVDYLTPKGTISQSKHFDTRIYEEALELYIKHFDEFGGWNSHKNNLAWRNVLGNIARLFPANYAQLFCQGSFDVLRRGNKLKRNLEFNDGTPYFPLASKPGVAFGKRYAVRAGAIGYSECAGLNAAECALRVIREVRQIKEQRLWKIRKVAYQEEKLPCGSSCTQVSDTGSGYKLT
jgi:hypothetical protein